MKPAIFRFCTLTGADDSTDIAELLALSEVFPFVEWGVLVSAGRTGTARYPSRDWITALMAAAQGLKKRPNLALHLCGPSVKEFIAAPDRGFVAEVAPAFGRIQLNLNRKKFSTEAIAQAIGSLMGTSRVITQHNQANAQLAVDLLPFGLSNHEVLFDSSGGRGVLARSWPSVAPEVTHIPHGYAGGLSPDNICEEIDWIAQAAQNRPFWVDMEGQLRTEQDQFGMHKVRSVLAQLQDWLPKPPKGQDVPY